jgi:hypothetical protein
VQHDPLHPLEACQNKPAFVNDVVVEDDVDLASLVVDLLQGSQKVKKQPARLAVSFNVDHALALRIIGPGNVAFLVLPRSHDDSLGSREHPVWADSRIQMDVDFVGMDEDLPCRQRTFQTTEKGDAALAPRCSPRTGHHWFGTSPTHSHPPQDLPEVTGREANAELLMNHPCQQFKGPRIAGKRIVGRRPCKNLPDSFDNVLVDLPFTILRSAIEQRGFPQEQETLYDVPSSRRDTSDSASGGMTAHAPADLEENPAANADICVSGFAIEFLKSPSDWAVETDELSHFETSLSLCSLPIEFLDKETQRRSPTFVVKCQFRYFDSCETI